MTVPDALDRLQHALEDLAGALQSGQAHLVLAAEGPLADALRALDAGVRPNDSDRQQIRQRIDRLRGLVARCRAHGSASAGLIDAMFPQTVYGRPGGSSSPAATRAAAFSRIWR
jgi:hypothetical protein